MEKAREPTVALRFANAQRAASVGAPLAFSTNSFVHRAILWIDEAAKRRLDFFEKKSFSVAFIGTGGVV